MKHSQIVVNEIELHVVEHGEGKPVLFCHGFPDLWRGWRLQMEALAVSGYHTISLDMRGYGQSSAPVDPLHYTPLHTLGDLVGLLDALNIPDVTIVGHDFGASVAWNAALMRPDRFTAVFCASVPFLPLGGPSFIEAIVDAGGKNFYMLDQMKPEAVELWANAAITYPSFLYWSSGSPSPTERWTPFTGNSTMVRPAPVAIPSWANLEDVAYAVSEFERTGFAGGLNYYRSINLYFNLTKGFSGLTIKQPSFFLIGEADGLNQIRKTTEEELRVGLPGLIGLKELPDVGHWPNREAPEAFNDSLLRFLERL